MKEQAKTMSTSFEESCANRQIDQNQLPGVDNIPERFRQSVQDFYRMLVVNEDLNIGEDGEIWDPDYSKNNDEPKYEIWFNVEPPTKEKPGGGLSFGGVDYWDSNAGVGPRLSYRNRDIARHAAKHFIPHFEGMKLMPKK